MTFQTVFEHLFLVLVSGFFSIVIGVPLGILAYRYPKARGIILRIVDVLQTIPALALLGIIMVFAGAGKATVITGITLYSLLPIVQNTCIGLEQVDPGVKESARGMGMTATYSLFRVELPLAFPTMFTGIRIAIVNAIGTAVFAAYVGGGGLGGMLNQAIRVQDMRSLLTGTLMLMLIAVVLDGIMGIFENHIKKTHGSVRQMAVSLGVLAACVCVLTPVSLSYGNTSDTLVLYDGNYSEVQIMHHMMKILVEDRTDLSVTIKDQMTQVNNFKTLYGDNHSCDAMLSYDGTLLTTFLHEDPSDVPEGQTLYDYTNEEAKKKFGVYMLGKLGFDNTYAIAVPQEIADKYNLKTISDLVPVADQLVFGAESDFFTQEGSMKYGPFTEFYGLHFKDSVSVDVSLKYTAIENGSFDVTEVYATDGLNLKAGLVLLEDDLHFFPDYYGCFVVRDDTFDTFRDVAPDLESVLGELEGQISNEDMQQMTYRVDVEGEEPDTVARDFLEERGLLTGSS